MDRVKEELEVKILLRVSSQERTACWEFLLDHGSNMTCGRSSYRGLLQIHQFGTGGSGIDSVDQRGWLKLSLSSVY